MILLLEGPDGGGKTVLAESLGLPFQHNGPPPSPHPRDIFWWQLKSLLPREKCLGEPNYVVDRAWPSEQFYHVPAGRQETFDRAAHRMFERVMLGMNGVIIMCLPPLEVAKANWQKRVDEGTELIIDPVVYDAMYAFYANYETQTCVPTIRYDYTKDSLPGVHDELRERSERPDLPENVVGDLGSSILVVGERCNMRNPFEPHFPFVGPSRSSRWITEQFEIMGLWEHELAWANAWSPNEEETPPEILNSFPDLKGIVALGNDARLWAYNAVARAAVGRDIKIMTAPHPSGWMRFNHGKSWPGLGLQATLTEMAMR